MAALPCPSATPTRISAEQRDCRPSGEVYDLPCTPDNMQCFLFRRYDYEDAKRQVVRLLASRPATSATYRVKLAWSEQLAGLISRAIWAANIRFATSEYTCQQIQATGTLATPERKNELCGRVPESFPARRSLYASMQARVHTDLGRSRGLYIPVLPAVGFEPGVHYNTASSGVPVDVRKEDWVDRTFAYRASLVFQRYDNRIVGTNGFTRKACRACPETRVANDAAIAGAEPTMDYLAAWGRDLAGLDFDDLVADGIERWLLQYTPYVEGGAVEMTAAEFGVLQRDAMRVVEAARTRKVIGATTGAFTAVSTAAIALGASAAALGPFGGVVAAFAALANLLIRRFGAVGGWPCPVPPFLRSFLAGGCAQPTLWETSMTAATTTAVAVTVAEQQAHERRYGGGAEAYAAQATTFKRNELVRGAAAGAVGAGIAIGVVWLLSR